jgi:hypothetical protein
MRPASLLQNLEEGGMEGFEFLGSQLGEQLFVHGCQCLHSSTVISEPLRGDFQAVLTAIFGVSGAPETSILLKGVGYYNHLCWRNGQGVRNRLLALRLIMNQMKGSPLARAKSAGRFHVLGANIGGFISGTPQKVRSELAELWRDTALVFHRSTICQGTVRLAPKVTLVPFSLQVKKVLTENQNGEYSFALISEEIISENICSME